MQSRSKDAAPAPAAEAAPIAAPVAAPAPAPAPAPAKAEPVGDPKEARRLAAAARQQLADKTKPFKKELEQIDKKLPQLNAQRDALETKLATPGLPGADIVEAGKQLSAVNGEIEQLEERWLELSEQIEAISQELNATA
jgi:ATP-binding cassette subfamily F protein 3